MTSKGKILAVDDTPASLKLLTEILQVEGYEVRSAISGDIALHSATLNPPELILLDIRMPGVDGFEVCRRLKAQPETCEVPIIFVTSLSETNEKVEGFELGAVDFVTKPYQREELLIRVRTHLEMTRLRNRLEFLVAERTHELEASLEMVARREEALRLAEHKRNEMLQTLQEGVVTVNAAGQITYSNQVAQELLDIGQEITGKHFQSYEWRCVDERGEPCPPDRLPLAIALRKHRRSLDIEHGYVTHDGTTKWLSVNAAPLIGETGNVSGAVASFRDITERKCYEAELEHQANHDLLTGLPNRNLLRDRLSRAIVRANRHSGIVAVMFLDLDHFKVVNDSLGHQAGDLLLSEMATRLCNCMRQEDTVARHGGDEFVVILHDVIKEDDVAGVAQKLLAAISTPFLSEGREFYSSASIGIACYPRDGGDEVTLLKNADSAMYRAKSKGRNNFQFYTPEINEWVFGRLALESALHRALEREEFLLHYQPQIDLRSGRICGMEALVRWQHPEQGLLSPAQFISTAEDTGLIVPLGKWILHTACAQAKAWVDRGFDITVAVNLSGRQLQQSDFPRSVKEALDKTGLEPRYLELELTEGILIEQSDSILARMREVEDLGVQFSIDDFGTGYSSLSYLKRFPIDRLKIDQSFVRDIVTEPEDAAIVSAIISMAHNLNLKVMAEGVETKEQREFLRSRKCDEIQGYFIAKPLPGADIMAMLALNHYPEVCTASDDERSALLLVDDEESVLNALARLFRRDGYRILTTTSATEALGLLAVNDVGVIICDQRMPEMIGVDFLRRVKQLHPDSVRMVLSGYTDLKSVTDAINEGAVYKFITKPWDDALLRASVDEAFRRYSMKKENDRLIMELAAANEELSLAKRPPENRTKEADSRTM